MKYGTFEGTLYIRIYDSNGLYPVEGAFDSDNFQATATSRYQATVTSGEVYYIRVSISYGNSLNGTYQIGFTNTQTSPDTLAAMDDATGLTLNEWSDGSLTAQKRNEWYKFTATSATPYIHVKHGTVDSALYIWLYDSAGLYLGEGNFNNGSYQATVTNGQVHYIWVRAVLGSTNGTFFIGFTNTHASPDILAAMAGATELTTGTWADGNITSEIAVSKDPAAGNWFKFTATATAPSQYIHLKAGTILTYGGTDVYLYLRDSTGLPVENAKAIYAGNHIQPTVTSGQVYYVQIYPVLSSTTGTYQVTLSTSATVPEY
jgi:hypothetical protein